MVKDSWRGGESAGHFGRNESRDPTDRTSLPPDLLALLAALPRDGWPDGLDFGGLATFWLHRRPGFRHLNVSLRTLAPEVEEGRMHTIRSSQSGWDHSNNDRFNRLPVLEKSQGRR